MAPSTFTRPPAETNLIEPPGPVAALLSKDNNCALLVTEIAVPFVFRLSTAMLPAFLLGLGSSSPSETLISVPIATLPVVVTFTVPLP